MALAPGTRLGGYEILSQIGVGGMGEVYQAKDTRLKRDVALKVLPDTFAQDTDRLARFQREAELLATLNHPNIAGIYGLEESNGVRALVLELVEGPTLADRIATGPIPLDEALPIAQQIAEALEAAHEKGVIHRDLKPANIKVTPDGSVKVLDFGLAKLAEAPAASGAGVGVSQSPTITTPAMMTGVGTILGTAAYMSPEQAKGRPADKRSDVWAFGCVLYEMLTGKRAFEGEDVSDTLAAVLRAEPNWSLLPVDLAPALKSLVRRCVDKDRRRRIADMSIVLYVIDEPSIGAAPTVSVAMPSAAPPQPAWKRAAPFALTAVLAGAVIGGVMWSVRPSLPPQAVTRFSFTLPEGQVFTSRRLPSVAIAPDGTQVAYVANNRLYIRSMSEPEAKPISGTDASNLMGSPVFSPDGQSIVFYLGNATGGAGALKRVAVSGGAPVTVCDVGFLIGISWDRDSIVFAEGGGGVKRVAANGGRPEVLVPAKNGEAIQDPHMLPGGEALLFGLAAFETPNDLTLEHWDKATIVVQSLKTGQRKTLIEGGSAPRYLATGHLVYAQGGALLAVPFDLKRLEVTGGPVPVAEGVSRPSLGSLSGGLAQLDISNTGSLVYVSGASTPSAQADLALMDRSGSVERLKAPPRVYQFPRVSPDGRRLAVGTGDGKEANIWIDDLTGATSMRQLTVGGRNRFPVWSADGAKVTFQSDREGDAGIFWQRADGSGTAERLTKADPGSTHVPESWSPDGTHLSFEVVTPPREALWILTLPEKTVAPFGDVQADLPAAIASMFSPDGRWLAYTSTGGGGLRVFVQPFPSTGAKYAVSPGAEPLWSRDGKELVVDGVATFNVMSVKTAPGFAFSDPVPVSKARLRITGPIAAAREYDMTGDGRRFIGVTDTAQGQSAPAASQIQVVLNWSEELKQRVPTK